MNAIDAAALSAMNERTSPGYTKCWGVIVPHIIVDGMTLTPRIETELHQGHRVPRHIDGVPFVERHLDGSIVYALPGGGAYIHKDANGLR
jgi:hypothetical protein